MLGKMLEVIYRSPMSGRFAGISGASIYVLV